jgi:hypothetical protein
MNPQILSDLKTFYPELILTAAILAVVIGDLVFLRIRNAVTFGVAALGLILSFACSIPFLTAFRIPLSLAFWP